MLCSQVGIAGSTTTGDYVVMAGQVGVRDHVHIGNRAVLGAMAGITNDVPDGGRMIGIPATPEREQKIKQAVMSRLPEMRQQLKQLAGRRRQAHPSRPSRVPSTSGRALRVFAQRAMERKIKGERSDGPKSVQSPITSSSSALASAQNPFPITLPSGQPSCPRFQDTVGCS